MRLSRREIAEAATIDAPAATVAVNDLEQRGLVMRRVDPANRRTKLVSLTDKGRKMIATIGTVDDPAHLAHLSDDDLETRPPLLRLSTLR